jgi:hypothetical protein
MWAWEPRIYAAIEGKRMMNKELLAVAGGIGVVVLLRNMLARTLNPFLGALKITWPV